MGVGVSDVPYLDLRLVALDMVQKSKEKTKRSKYGILGNSACKSIKKTTEHDAAFGDGRHKHVHPQGRHLFLHTTVLQ